MKIDKDKLPKSLHHLADLPSAQTRHNRRMMMIKFFIGCLLLLLGLYFQGL